MTFSPVAIVVFLTCMIIIALAMIHMAWGVL